MIADRHSGELTDDVKSSYNHAQMLHHGAGNVDKPVTRVMIALIAAISFLMLVIGLITTEIFPL